MDARTLQQQLLDMEARFWKGSADYYARNLAADALMVFGDPVGVMDRDETVRSIADAPRWQDVAFEDVAFVVLTPDAAVVTYRASARREDGAQYIARASSAYVNRGGWRLAFHQQTPAGASSTEQHG
jgi:hypothetical protein